MYGYVCMYDYVYIVSLVMVMYRCVWVCIVVYGCVWYGMAWHGVAWYVMYVRILPHICFVYNYPIFLGSPAVKCGPGILVGTQESCRVSQLRPAAEESKSLAPLTPWGTTRILRHL